VGSEMCIRDRFWERVEAMGWGLEKTLGSAMLLAAIFDRDYRCEEEIAEILGKLNKSISTAFVHRRKEIENYLLVPGALQRAIEAALQDRVARTGQAPGRIETAEALLAKVTGPMKSHVLGQCVDCRVRFLRSPKQHSATITTETVAWFEEKWANMDSRLELVPGKETLSKVGSILQDRYSISLTDGRIIGSMRQDDIPSDLVDMLHALDIFRKTQAPGD